MWLLAFLVWFLSWAGGMYWYLCGRPSPFSEDCVKPAGPMELNQKKRDKLLKQGEWMMSLSMHWLIYQKSKMPLKRLHYVGQLHENSLFKIIFDQITEGQLEFAELDQHFDTVVIGTGKETREYTICSGKTEMEEHLKKQFPDDTEAIEEFFKIMKLSARKTPYLAALKLIPEWLALFLVRSGLANLYSSAFQLLSMNATDLVEKLTSNKDLQVIFAYYFYGTPPRDSSSLINALMLHHFKRGAYYPKGGASEIPYHITKVIQKYGGNVLVRAPVSQILVDSQGAAYGVAVKKGKEEIEVRAPVVISNCGIFNTFKRLLPPEIQVKPEIQKRLDMVRPGKGSLLLFSGFDGTAEELGISAVSRWVFKNNDMDAMLVLMQFFFYHIEGFSVSKILGKEEAPENIPMMFVTFPSPKDPMSQIRHPGKSCMTILTMVNYEWFEEWKDTPVKRRGADYVEYKNRFAKHLFDWACVLYPKLREKLVFQDVATPLTNNFYLGSYRGAIYSTDHNLDRYHMDIMAKNRCETPVKNLYVSGQDMFSCGIIGALHGGLMCASRVLGRMVYIDLLVLKKKLKKRKALELAALTEKKLQ
uniref:Si:ch1073-13h15.3 n=1 Tax=Astyanax mexicanus TaxID=7994 RepID=A0A3B1K6G1_ASTMX